MLVETPVGEEEWGLPTPNLEAAFKSTAKYAKSQPLVDERLMNKVFVDFLIPEFWFHMNEANVVSMAEAINDLELSSSPGVPWNLEYGLKRNLLEDPDFVPSCEFEWRELEKANFVSFFKNSTKEEVRLKQKIRENKIRTFTASSVTFTVAGSMMFLDMNEKFYRSYLKHSSAVGINPYNRGWEEVRTYLSVFERGFELDESEYDSSLFQMIFHFILNFRWMCLKEEFKTEEIKVKMENYYRNLVFSVMVLADGSVVLKNTGNPSGSVNTIVDNTLALFMLLSYAWLVLVPDEWKTWNAMKEHTRFVLTGDDNTWTVSEEAMPFFNADSVSHVFSGVGVTTTSPCYDPRPLRELRFLSRRFDVCVTDRDGREVVLPVFGDRGKILASLRYSEKPTDPVYALVRAVGIYTVTWGDPVMRFYMHRYIQWLIRTFGSLFCEDPDWRGALQGYKPDDIMFDFYVYPKKTGKSIVHKAREKETYAS